VTGAAGLDAARITDGPFTLGVASGDPQPGSARTGTPACQPVATAASFVTEAGEPGLKPA
jgi:phosphodiesterase/alkaline phosphatase D-like protein